jgi:hypothetical protein
MLGAGPEEDSHESRTDEFCALMLFAEDVVVLLRNRLLSLFLLVNFTHCLIVLGHDEPR